MWVYFLPRRMKVYGDFLKNILKRRLSEQSIIILNKQQPLNLDAIRRLNQDFGISAEVLIKPYSLEKASA